MSNILITGRPGSGKGTQAVLLADRLGIPHISTGDIFREHMRAGTPLGVQITDSMNAGQYTSDEITNAVIQERLAEDDAKGGFILDGYPRTMNQVDFLDSINVHIDSVIDLHIDEDLAVNRLLLRAQEQKRGDDTEEVIRGRMGTYARTVTPVLDEYKARGVLVEFSAVGKVADIHRTLLDALA